jgi:2-dehydro-3-deoxyphosphooctonate aldolase (KDO 8-P synthase)
MKNSLTARPLKIIAGPCVIEDKRTTLDIASSLLDMVSPYGFEFTFKASFDKANRTSLSSFRGPGLSKGMAILAEIKKKFKVKLLSDVHSPEQVSDVKNILDIIQIPAFLCRQTDLIVAAARSKKTINIKKGQFLAPGDMEHVIKKVESAGNRSIMLTERGSCFGYNNLIVDFRSFLIMKEFGYPVIFDVTHSLQRPSAAGGISGGDSAFALKLALAGVACGVDGIFMEVHPRPVRARSDKHTSLALSKVPELLKNIMKVRKALYEKD